MTPLTLLRAVLLCGLLAFSAVATAAHDGLHAGDLTSCDFCPLLGHGGPAPAPELLPESSPAVSQLVLESLQSALIPPGPHHGRWQRAPPVS